MAKNVTLEEGADALVIRSANSKTVKSIPYGAITQLDKKVAPTLSGNSVIPDYITVKADGKETIIFHKDVVSPVTTNVHTLFSTVWGWVYTDTAPTLAPTTAAPTTAAPSYEFSATGFHELNSWMTLSAVEGDVSALLESLVDDGYTFEVIDSIANDKAVTIIKASIGYYAGSDRTSFRVNETLVNETSPHGKLVATAP